MKDEEITMWADAYAAFVGAFDTPIQRRYGSTNIYAVDARERLRAWNEQMREIVATSAAATRTLEALGYEYSGGEVWKPPVSPQERHEYKIDLNTLRAGDRVKVTFVDKVIDEAATLICTPRYRQGWLTLTFIDKSGRDFFRSKSRGVRVEEIDGRLYACGRWQVEVVEWTNSNE